MDVRDIRAMHEVEQNLLDRPFPNTPLFSNIQEAIRFFERAHQHRGFLLAEVEQLQQAIINENYAVRLEAENAELLSKQLEQAERERDEALAALAAVKRIQEATLGNR